MTQHIQPRSASQRPLPHTNHESTVLLFGEVLADIFPDQTVLGGAPFNVARHLKAFDLNPVLVTRMGEDALRDEVLNVMSQNSMETIGIQNDKHYPTGRVKVHFDGGQNSFDILPFQAYDFIHPEAVRMTTLSVHPALVYFGTLAQRHEISRGALQTLLHSTDAAKFLDINLRAPWYDETILRQSLHYADIVKLNAEELELLTKMFALPGANAEEQIMGLMHQFELEQALVTCGDQGAWQINRNGEKITAMVKQPISRIVDTVGAGDGFAAVCILGELQHWPMAKTLDRAIAFASAICEIRGAIPKHADFYQPFTREWGV